MRLFNRDDGWATATFLALLTLSTLSYPASAVPKPLDKDSLSPRASGDQPGLGIELEVTSIRIVSNGNDWTEEDREKLKGSKVIPIEFAGDPKTNWTLTAETF